MKEWVIEIVKKNQSFPNLEEKVRFRLVGLISKQLTEIQENRGPEFFEAYKVTIEPILTRVNWIYVKRLDFPFKRWNGIKRQVEKILKGNDSLVNVPIEVVRSQVNAIDKMVDAFVNGHQVNHIRKEDEWVKNPMGGWIKKPRNTPAI